MTTFFTRVTLGFAAILFSLVLPAQSVIEKEIDFLPKYPTASERAYIDGLAAERAELWLQRGEIDAAARAAGSCEGNCGGQSGPNSCWCDSQCADFGDCCDDYAEFCLNQEPPVELEMPEGIIVPGEFEELQSLVLRWPYGSSTGATARLYAGMIEAIQQEVPVWIFINNANDSNIVKNSLANFGVTLSSYEFLITQTNSIWIRDYGPWGFYYGANDDLAFIDMQYYPSRPLDNQVPAWLANHMGIDVYTSAMYEEGGNLMVDGFGNAFHSTGIFPKNQSLNGWSPEVTRSMHQALFNTVSATETDRLLCDGGTGHIDMYAKLLDEQTMIVSEYPEEVTASDRLRIEENVQLFEAAQTTFNGNYTIIRLPMPLRDNGSFSTTCNQINADARGFVNGVLVNRTFIVPIYTNENSSQANRDWDEAALEAIRAAMPGYKVVGLDARSLTTGGGAIHCVTMQIPADNPIRFRHERLAFMQAAAPAYHISAEIYNRSGIEQASLFWKRKQDASWNEVPMSGQGSAFSAAIPNMNFTTTDTIVYYLHAEAVNGKTLSKPIVAPEGYFYFMVDGEMGPGACFPPLNTTTSNVGAANATLSWSAVAGAEGYEVRGGPAGTNNFQNFQIPNGNTTSINVNILQPGLTYQWQVRAICSGVAGDYSDFEFVTTAECPVPANLQAQNVTTQNANLSWTAIPGATGYQVRGKNVGAPGYQFFEVGAANTSITTPNLLLPNTLYEWSVRAYCNNQKTATSAWAANGFFSTPLVAPLQVTSVPQPATPRSDIYPNPATDVINIAAQYLMGHVKVSLRDMTGRELMVYEESDVDGSVQLQWSLTGLAQGMYLIEIRSGDFQQVHKLVHR